MEKMFTTGIMLVGVLTFSFATGSLSSVLSNLDSANAKLKEKVQVLDQIRDEYGIPMDLYEDIYASVKFDVEKDKSDLTDFISTLPRRLKYEVNY